MAPKVLLVDDDALMHRLYRQHIERAGYQMLSASTGAQAIEIATRELPQVIVMDIMMPELDGLSAIREIKRADATKTIPVIVVTANPQYHLSQQESQWAGATIFLTKPFSPAQLVSALQRLVPNTGAAS
jgi:two-component system alkaline phosphatase synthesis response regulator PhoP